MLITWEDENTTPEEKLQVLLAYHKLSKDFKIDEEDIPMIVIALNQDDIASVSVDNEGGLAIEYYGDSWNNEQATI